MAFLVRIRDGRDDRNKSKDDDGFGEVLVQYMADLPPGIGEIIQLNGERFVVIHSSEKLYLGDEGLHEADVSIGNMPRS